MGLIKKEFSKISIGKETTVGTAATRTHRVPGTDFAYIQEEPTKSELGVITGRNSSSGYSLDAIDYSAELQTLLMANHANHFLLHSLFGAPVTTVQVGAAIGISYNGAAESCKLEVASGSIKASVGEKGAEAPDPNFGEDGTIAISASSTVATIMAAINGESDYSAVLLNGTSTDEFKAAVVIARAQAKGRIVPVFAASSTSGVYAHFFRPNYTNGENPTVSLQTDGTGDNQLGVGGAVNTMSLSGSAKEKMTVSWNLLFLSVIGGQTTTMLTLLDEDLEAMKFSEGFTGIAGVKWCFIKNLSLELNNNIATDEGYCQGTFNKQQHVRGKFAATGSMTISVTDDGKSETEKAKVLSDGESSLLALYRGRMLKDGLNSMLFFDLPVIQYTTYSKSATDTSLEQSMDFEAVDLGGAYDDHVSVVMITDWSA